ncbi:MAG: RHS repeat protein [Paludibacteraceae bacterium]|nr:RHS repeat protein [Paludibacteraceae bacterium]
MNNITRYLLSLLFTIATLNASAQWNFQIVYGVRAIDTLQLNLNRTDYHIKGNVKKVKCGNGWMDFNAKGNMTRHMDIDEENYEEVIYDAHGDILGYYRFDYTPDAENNLTKRIKTTTKGLVGPFKFSKPSQTKNLYGNWNVTSYVTFKYTPTHAIKQRTIFRKSEKGNDFNINQKDVYTYNNSGKLKSIITYSNNKITTVYTYAYKGGKLVADTVKRDGELLNSNQYSYFENGMLKTHIKKIYFDREITQSLTNLTDTCVYDQNGLLIKDRRTRYTYNANGQLLETLDPFTNKVKRRLWYNDKGKVIKDSSARGKAEFDDYGRMTGLDFLGKTIKSTNTPDGLETTMYSDDKVIAKQVIDTRDSILFYEQFKHNGTLKTRYSKKYDENGRLIEHKTTNGGLTTNNVFTYNAMGNLQSVSIDNGDIVKKQEFQYIFFENTKVGGNK